MRKVFETISASDRSLLLLVVGLPLLALLCALLMARADANPRDARVVTMCKTGSKRDRDETRDFRAALHAAHPDLHLKVFETSLDRKSDTMISAGVPPDLIYVGSDKLDYQLEADSLLDLTDLIRGDPELNEAVFGSTPDFYAETIRPFLRDGRLHVLPVNFNVFVLFYNRDLFDRHRVPYPDENWDWDGLRDRALALTRDLAGRRPDQAGFDPDHVVTYGFHYAMWQHGPENFIRQAGGRLVSDDGARMTADDPRTVAALQFLYDLKFRDRSCPPGQQLVSGSNSFDLFTRGKLGMYIYGVFAIPSLRDRAADMEWDVAPLPRGPDGRRASIIYTNAYGISKKCADPQAAFRVLKFMVSGEGLAVTARHQVFLPARRSMMSLVTSGDARQPSSTWALTHAVDHGYAQPTFATRQFYQDVFDCVNEHLDRLLGYDRPLDEPAQAAAAITREGNRILSRDRAVRQATPYGWLAAAAFILAPGALLMRRVVRRPGVVSASARREARWGMLLISPWVVGFLVFAAGPILVSLAMSFAQWQSLSDFTRAEFIGVENYRVALSGDDPKFWTALAVTARYAALAVPLGLVAGLALAVLVNQRVRGISAFRTAYYLPVILPSIATAVLWWRLFDTRSGWINRLISSLDFRGWISRLAESAGESLPIAWLQSPNFTPWVFVVMSLWTAGGGMMIYLAGLQSIPTQLYEAAEIDGAGRWSRFRHVTLPLLSPVILFNLIMGVIASFQVFNAAFVLFDGETGPSDAGLFYVLHLFREAFFRFRLGYASALAWMLFALVLALTALVFRSSPLWVHYEAARERPR